MKKIVCIMLVFIVTVLLSHNPVVSDDYLSDYIGKDTKQIYELLKSKDGHRVLEEMKYIEDLGEHEPIPFAVSLYEKTEDFTVDELLLNLVDNKGRPAIQATLVEMLEKKDYDFSRLLFLQNTNIISDNTKQLLLLSEDIGNEYLINIIQTANDYRTVSAMQQLCQNDILLAKETTQKLLLNNDVSYFQIAAMNIGVELTSNYQVLSEEEKNTFYHLLSNKYPLCKSEMEKFWIADSMGWCSTPELYGLTINSTLLDEFDRHSYILASRQMIVQLINSESGYNEIIQHYLDNTEDDSVYYLLCNNSLEELYSKSNNRIDNLKSLSSYKGYAVYRGGVLFGLEYHAAIMYINKVNNTGNVVIHAKGTGEVVQFGTWAAFKNGESFKGATKPAGVSMSSTLAVNVTSKAYALIGQPYILNGQIRYSCPTSGSKVDSGHITKIRCDGVVEYCYEYFGKRVGGPNGSWDISINLSANYNAHDLFHITPRDQIDVLMDVVETSEANMY
ncbi:MAG: hypothetical protein IIY75_08920 [Erysipelotrichales bacterium]|nr:hypothetical protein [Erysipelotrichales bacterium]